MPIIFIINDQKCLLKMNHTFKYTPNDNQEYNSHLNINRGGEDKDPKM